MGIFLLYILWEICLMIQICKNNKEKVCRALLSGKIDAADVCVPNLIDSIILSMKKHGLLDFFPAALEDKREKKRHIPFGILLILSVAAKLKQKTSLTDVPFAISDPELLAEIGWNVWDSERDINDGLFSENVMRKLVDKYSGEEWVACYNHYLQDLAAPHMQMEPDIHILDCTKIPVNLKNENYEGSSVVKIDGEVFRGYKLGVLRGITGDTGIIEEITFGTLKTHDLEHCREMLLRTPCLKEGDILINDRGFLSRNMANALKSSRNVDTYIPARENMAIFQEAVQIAKTRGKWQKHPNRKRKEQEVQLVTDLGPFWESDAPEQDVPINACVVHDKKAGKYFVFMTTDTTKTARQIVNTYELRPEIEEDFRQIKEFWKLEDFKSTKYHYITFHIVMTLFGYLFFQIYKSLDEGEKFAGKCLPVAAKKYQVKKPASIVIFSGQYYAVFSLIELLQIYAECTLETRQLLEPILGKV